MVTATKGRTGRGTTGPLTWLGGLSVVALGALAVSACDGDPAAALPSRAFAAPVDTTEVDVPPERASLPEVLGVAAAVEAPWGWVVLDVRALQLVYLSATGDLLRVAGRGGEGPGELLRPVSLAMASEQVVVAELDGRLRLFDHGGAWVRDVTPRLTGCGGFRVLKILSAPDSLPSLGTCLAGNGRTSARVDLLTLDGGRRPVLEASVRDFASGLVDPLRLPMLGRAGERLAFGMAPDPCLQILDVEGVAAELLCYPDLPRPPTPDSIRAGLLPLQERLSRMGVTMTVPDHLPPFRDLLTAGDRWAFLALRADGGDALDRVSEGRLHRILLPEGTQVFLGRRSALLAEERMDGTAFSIVPLP